MKYWILFAFALLAGSGCNPDQRAQAEVPSGFVHIGNTKNCAVYKGAFDDYVIFVTENTSGGIACSVSK